jgi:hypothetical protein
MYPLATVLPFVRRIRLPFSRDQAMLLLMAVNMAFLGVDTYLAHHLSGEIRGFEWIPIIFGPIAAVLLLVAGLFAARNRSLANSLGSLVFLTSFLVGALGTFFHIRRALLIGGSSGSLTQLNLFVWAPPFIAPMAFCLVAVMGLSAIWLEEPTGSGRLLLFRGRTLTMPYSKTQAYFFMVALGVLIALVSSTLDHARTGFGNPWLLIPLSVGIFSMTVSLAVGFQDHPSPSDLAAFTGAMGLLVLTGMVGAVLHLNDDLIAQAAVLPERFLRGAPILAPMLFANFGLLGWITLFDPQEKKV